jgi:hypothetical protein
MFIALWAIARRIDRAQRQQYELIKYLNTADPQVSVLRG